MWFAFPVLLSSRICVITAVKMLWTREVQPSESTANFDHNINFKENVFKSWKSHRVTHWRKKCCVDSHLQGQISQSDWGINSNCGKIADLWRFCCRGSRHCVCSILFCSTASKQRRAYKKFLWKMNNYCVYLMATSSLACKYCARIQALTPPVSLFPSFLQHN